VDDSLNGAIGQLLAYHHELDRRRPDAAEVHLRHIVHRVDSIPALYRGTILLEAAFFYAVHRHDAAGARSWLERARKTPAEAHVRHRASAAVLLAEGDAKGALEMIARAERALGAAIEAGMVAAHHDELSALRAAAQRDSAVAR
jgi:hypothetical protein